MSSLAALAASPAIAFKPHGAYAQQPALPRRIGVLLAGFSPESKEVKAFREGLRDAGYVEGRDVVIEWRFANGDYARLPELAADLAQRKVDVIVVESTVAVRAAKQATTTIPIVMALVGDPVGSGLVANLAHPAENITGLSLMTVDLSAKRLQLLKELVPRASRIAILWNPITPWHAQAVRDLKAVAPAMSIELKFVAARGPEDLSSAFLQVRQAHAQAMYVIENAVFSIHRDKLLALASQARIAVIYGQKDFAEQGGLIAYGTNFVDMFRRSAGYVDKILKGAKPSDLPIEQPTKFELVVNLKTAKALGITIPRSILLQADEVIK